MLLQVLAGHRGEVRELRHRDVDLHDARAGLPALDVRDEVRRQLRGRDQVEEPDLRDARTSRRSGARSSVPSSSMTPWKRPPDVRILTSRARSSGSRRRRTPRSAGSSRRPRPSRPAGSPTSRGARRRRRRSSDAASRTRCPGSSGPAHVPMIPLTASIPFISSDSNQSSSRSVMLIVNSRVTSATPRTPSLRTFHAVRAVSSRSPIASDPARGGLCSSSGPRMSATPFSHASHSGSASASFFENCAIESYERSASSA